tara:strand:- start:453 stop:713 length:261 start_codon:yes stop_codon:yes gene_type:complete
MRQKILDNLTKHLNGVEVAVDPMLLRDEAKAHGPKLRTRDGTLIELGAFPVFENPHGVLVWFSVPFDTAVSITPTEEDKKIIARTA